MERRSHLGLTWITRATENCARCCAFEALVHDLRILLRLGGERAPDPSAVIVDARTLRSTPESGHRAGYDGHKRKKGSKLHMVVDTLGHLLTLEVTPASEQERAQVGELMAEAQLVTDGSVALAFVDQGYTGDEPAAASAEQGVVLEVVKLPDAKRGFVLLPPLGGRAELRVDDALPPLGARLRTAARDPRKFITPSNNAQLAPT